MSSTTLLKYNAIDNNYINLDNREEDAGITFHSRF